MTIFGLVIFGLIMVSSASVAQSLLNTDTNYYYVIRQAIYAGIGLALWWVLQRIDYHYWKQFATLLLGLALLSLILVLVPGIGFESGGARRWIHLGPASFQVSEFVKLAIVVYLAFWFERKGPQVVSTFKTFLPFVGLLGAIFLLVMQQPDLGTAMTIAFIAGSMYLVAGATWTQLMVLAGSGVTAVALLIYAAPYRLRRLITFLNPGADPLGAGYHINQALLAIGSGGVFGLGYGRSRQKFNYLPESASDSIFAVAITRAAILSAACPCTLPNSCMANFICAKACLSATNLSTSATSLSAKCLSCFK